MSAGSMPGLLENRPVRILPLPLALSFLLVLAKAGRATPGGARGGAKDPRSDEDLYRGYADGDRRAFDRLLERHGTGVYRYLARYLGDDEMARDVTQDVFLKVVSAAREFRGGSTFYTYLYRVAVNTAVDVRRARDSRPERHARSLDAPAGRDDDGLSLASVIPGAAPSGELRTLSGELSQALEAGLARLPLEQRETFLLREVEGLSFAEIAGIAGVNENTVKSRMLYALKGLRQSLAGFGGLR